MSQTENHSEPVKFQNDYPDDEIELIDIFRVLWKWKYLIVGGVAVFALAALVISLMLPKIYQIETLVQPGILSINEEGKNIYVDTPDNIKSLIEAGAFDLRILNRLAETHGAKIPKTLKFKVSKVNGSNILKILYKTSKIGQGIEILDLLEEFLINEYSHFVEYFQNKFDREIDIARAEIEKINSIKQSTETNIVNIEKRIYELKQGIISVNENTNHLKQERNTLLLRPQNEGNILSAILYSNTIQQNLQLANVYDNEIKELRLEKENEQQKISDLENNVQIQLTGINGIEFKKNIIQNIKILRKPFSGPFPIKPQKMINVIFATLGGLLIMVFFSFFLEFLAKFRNENQRPPAEQAV